MKHRRDILKGMVTLGVVAALPGAAIAALPIVLPSPSTPILAKAPDPFATGSAIELTRLVESLVEDIGGDGVMWKGRKFAVLHGAMMVLVWKRDQGRIVLDAATVLEHLDFDRYVALASEPGLPDRVHGGIQACLTSIPGYGWAETNGAWHQVETNGAWHQVTLSQFEFSVMEFQKGLRAMIATNPVKSGAS